MMIISSVRSKRRGRTKVTLRRVLRSGALVVGREKTFGPDHTSTLNTPNNLGRMYHDQGKLVKAKQTYQQALLGWEKAFGPDHTSTLYTLNKLGHLYHDQCKLNEANEIFERAERRQGGTQVRRDGTAPE